MAKTNGLLDEAPQTVVGAEDPPFDPSAYMAELEKLREQVRKAEAKAAQLDRENEALHAFKVMLAAHAMQCEVGSEIFADMMRDVTKDGFVINVVIPATNATVEIPERDMRENRFVTLNNAMEGMAEQILQSLVKRASVHLAETVDGVVRRPVAPSRIIDRLDAIAVESLRREQQSIAGRVFQRYSTPARTATEMQMQQNAQQHLARNMAQHIDRVMLDELQRHIGVMPQHLPLTEEQKKALLKYGKAPGPEERSIFDSDPISPLKGKKWW